MTEWWQGLLVIYGVFAVLIFLCGFVLPRWGIERKPEERVTCEICGSALPEDRFYGRFCSGSCHTAGGIG